MSAFFVRNTRLRASDLNELSGRAEAAHLGAAGFLTQENGREQVARNPRRDPPPRRAAASPCGAVPAIVRGCSGGVYSVDLYADGIGAPRTGRASLVLTEVQSLAPLAAGTVVLAHLQPAVAIASGAEPPASGGGGGDEAEEGEE